MYISFILVKLFQENMLDVDIDEDKTITEQIKNYFSDT